MSVRERLVLAGFALVSLVLRAAAFFRYRFDSDEPQHLHVTWGWTAGLVQYRDLFDNHAPLFHILSAPLLAVLGERPDILFYMRAPMLILFAIVIGCTYVLGKRLHSERAGLWAAALLSLFPPFFLKSLEYRTDNLWMTLWMITLIVITGGAMTSWRALAAGILIGLALCVSLKTTLLILTLAAAGAFTFLMNRRSIARVTIPFLLGASIAPAILVIYFRHAGAWQQLVYCVFTFNELLIKTRSPMQIWWPRLVYVPVMTLAMYALWRRHAATWNFFFTVAAVFFSFTLTAFWILISPRDLLPIMPLVMLFVATRRRSATPAIACALCIPFLFAYTENFRNQTREHVTMMKQVLRLTRPGEPLMDFKGETIYRRRPYYHILEFITRHELQAGIVRDTIAEDVVRARCYVAQADGDFIPPKGRAFLVENFLDMGRLRAAGQWVRTDGKFTIAIPGEYVAVNRFGRASGLLDGTPAGPRFLAAGPHELIDDSDERVAIVWAPAIARGLTPFYLQDRDF